MSNQLLRTIAGSGDCVEQLATVVRPVGPWRFLTPLDIVAIGDLYRCIPTDENGSGDFGTSCDYIHNWSPVTNEPFIGTTAPPDREFIRPMEHAFSTPLFEVIRG